MQDDLRHRPDFVSQFRADSVSQIVTDGPNRSRLLVSRLRRDTPDHGLAVMPKKQIDAVFAVLLQLREQTKRELYLDGKCVHSGSYAARTTSVVNHLHKPVANLLSPFDNLIFIVPQTALDAIADERGVARVSELRCPTGGVYDETVWHLGNALLPALERPHEVVPLYADQVMLAANTYFAQAFGGLRMKADAAGTLAPWQLRRATEAMTALGNEEVSLRDLAAECDLSVSYFVRAFKMSTGEPPHRWMLRYRVECAKPMLAQTEMTLSEIALACRFADQSHFSRMFKSFVGMTPASWRRIAKS